MLGPIMLNWVVGNVMADLLSHQSFIELASWSFSSVRNFFTHNSSLRPGHSPILSFCSRAWYHRLFLASPDHQVATNKYTLARSWSFIIKTTRPVRIIITFNIQMSIFSWTGNLCLDSSLSISRFYRRHPCDHSLGHACICLLYSQHMLYQVLYDIDRWGAPQAFNISPYLQMSRFST